MNDDPENSKRQYPNSNFLKIFVFYHSEFVWYLFLGICLLSFFIGCSAQNGLTQDQVCFQNHCYEVEIVQKGEELARGLQFRQFLPKNRGMLFIFPQNARHSFWMKDTLIPLDIIWLDYARLVVYIQHNVTPCVQDPCPIYTPPTEAMYVLELNAHQAHTLQLKEGNQLEFRLKDKK